MSTPESSKEFRKVYRLFNVLNQELRDAKEEAEAQKANADGLLGELEKARKKTKECISKLVASEKDRERLSYLNEYLKGAPNGTGYSSE